MFCERGLHNQAQIACKVFPASEKFACEKVCTKLRGGAEQSCLGVEALILHRAEESLSKLLR